jgi:hypothetical protein
MDEDFLNDTGSEDMPNWAKDLKWSREDLRQACHAFIGRNFRNTAGQDFGTIRRTRLKDAGLYLQVYVELNPMGRDYVQQYWGALHTHVWVTVLKATE